MDDVKVLVFGAGGFVGRSLVRAMTYQESVVELVLVDRNPFAARNFGTKSGASERCVRIVEAQDLQGLADERFTHCIVLAGATNVDEALRRPQLTFDANIAVAREAGEWLRRQPWARMIYVSTDEVLGESTAALHETASIKPTQPYAASKAASEIILHSYRDTYQLDLVTLRSCNLIGAHQRGPKLLPVAVTRLLSRQKVPVFGDGAQRREWLSVDDLCEAIKICLSAVVPRGVLHCSSETSYSVIDVITIVAEALEVPPAWVHVEDRLVHDRAYAMSAARLRGYGWSSAVPAREALANAARGLAAAFHSGQDLTAVSPSLGTTLL